MVKKKQEATGEEMAAVLEDLVIGTKMRYHMYNKYRQFSELNFLKNFERKWGDSKLWLFWELPKQGTSWNTRRIF